MIFNYLLLIVHRLVFIIISYSPDFFVILNIFNIVSIAFTVWFAILCALTFSIYFFQIIPSIILSVFLNSFDFNKISLKVFLSIISLAINITLLNILTLSCSLIETMIWKLCSDGILNDLLKLILSNT